MITEIVSGNHTALLLGQPIRRGVLRLYALSSHEADSDATISVGSAAAAFNSTRDDRSHPMMVILATHKRNTSPTIRENRPHLLLLRRALWELAARLRRRPTARARPARANRAPGSRLKPLLLAHRHGAASDVGRRATVRPVLAAPVLSHRGAAGQREVLESDVLGGSVGTAVGVVRVVADLN